LFWSVPAAATDGKLYTLANILKNRNKNTFKFKLMKKIISIMLFITTITNAQEYKLEEKTVTGIFEVKDKTKAEIFASINKWISINYNSAKNVIQMNDLESGTIIIKGINEVSYKNSMKEIYPNNKYIQEYVSTKFNHLIEINIKDNKFRIIYKITDIASEDAGYNNLIFNCISFNGLNDTAINEYNEKMEILLKQGLIGKEKREKFKSLTKPTFQELSESIINDIKATMQYIEKSVNEATKDKW
jgi:hypothetical protein